jgi:hypothetical protein
MDSLWADEGRPSLEAVAEAPEDRLALALSLLGDPDSGVTRLCVVGLPEREAILMFVEARRQGLPCSLARGSSGGLTITLAAPEQRAGRPSPPRRPWARLRRAAAVLLGIFAAGRGLPGSSV